ncbi:hypothetical protein K1719_003843 [Acacia pycnantha]|nr:hypothetical protein K1719_003843 [Acacia pycnantha]
MNCLSHLSSYTSALITRNTYFVAKRSLFRVQCYSSGKGRKSGSKLRKLEPEPVMEQEKNAFFVVRKGDIVGIYNSLIECQAQVGSSICNPPVSVYKGYSLPKEAEDHLVSHGLKNALYTIKAADFNEDIFGTLVPCPFQDPASSEAGTSSNAVSKKRSLGVLGQENMDEGIGPTSPSEDPLKKQAKLDHSAVGQVSSSKLRTCIVEFDGASKGNPGKAGAGAILRSSDGSLICRLREGVGVATCNAAEYRALILGMKYALQKGFTGIHIQGDSKLVCMQIDGLWKIRNENMSKLHKVAKELKDKFLSFQVTHVLRNLNSEADAQANLAIDLADGQVQEVRD